MAVTIKNLDTWFKFCNAAPEKLASDIKFEINERSMDVLNQAVAIAPYKSGTLSRSINRRLEAGGFIGVVGASVNYAIPVEYGTYKRDATPFLGPAYEKIIPEYNANITKLLKGALK